MIEEGVDETLGDKKSDFIVGILIDDDKVEDGALVVE